MDGTDETDGGGTGWIGGLEGVDDWIGGLVDSWISGRGTGWIDGSMDSWINGSGEAAAGWVCSRCQRRGWNWAMFHTRAFL
jgi:hypothetical protein